MICKAIFIGKDGSMGFRKGQSYKIVLDTSSEYIWITYRYIRCPYGSMNALLKNWVFIDD